MDEIIDESLQSPEDYTIEQLKEAVLRRRQSMDRIKDVYKNDPRAKLSPLLSGIEAHVARDSAGGRGTSTYGNLINGMNQQREFLFQNQLQPELLQQKFDETDPFTDMFRKVSVNLNKSYKPDVKVIGGSLVKYDPKTDKTEVLFSDVKQSPIYAKIWDQIWGASLKENMRFTNDAERRAYVTTETDKAFAQAVSKDSTKLGPQTDPVGKGDAVELPRGPLTDANQTGVPTVIGSTPATKRPEPPPSKRFSVQSLREAAQAVRRGDMTKDEYNAIAKEGFGNVPQAAVAQSDVQPAILTPQQLATEGQLGKEHATENTADRQSMTDLRKLEESRKVLSQIISSGTNTSGAAHEFLNKLGGYMNYIDPKGELAKSASNDAVYFANMMNLVREKIAALGAGTAISNLDLIVTQKSVGDLRNTPEGNAKLLAIMELQNATMESKLGGKLNYFDENKSYDKYRGSSDPTHIVRASRLPNGETRYWVQTREGWINERLKMGDYSNPEAASKAFGSASVKATGNLIKGTGIKLKGSE